MKKEWVEPRIEVQKFTPNEYVAACYYFGGTHIILRQQRPGTDGRTDPYDQEKVCRADGILQLIRMIS